MARSGKAKDLFTASEVARFCQVDLKTIHNWADRGEIRHFRTPGRHLRFQRTDVLDFLRRYGYPVPDALGAGRPRVLLLVPDRGAAPGPATDLMEALQEDFDVEAASAPAALRGLIRMGANPPDAVILGASGAGVPVEDLVRALAQEERTRQVRAVVWGAPSDADRDALHEAGASAVLEDEAADGVRSTLVAMLGLDRG